MADNVPKLPEGVDPPPVMMALPWWVNILNRPSILAVLLVVVSIFGPSMSMLWTVNVEWPRQADRFHRSQIEHRDAIRELQRANDELLLQNYRQMLDLARMVTEQLVDQKRHLIILESLQKAISELLRAKQKEEPEHGP